MGEGCAVPKAHRWFFYSLDFRFKLETLLAADCWYRNAHFLNKVLLNSVCLSRQKALSSPSLSCWMFNWKCLLFVIHTHHLLKMSPAGLKVIFTEQFLTKNYNAFSRVNIVTWFMYSCSCFSGKWNYFVNLLVSHYFDRCLKCSSKTAEQGEFKETIVGLEICLFKTWSPRISLCTLGYLTVQNP